jgi:hypothetical protein
VDREEHDVGQLRRQADLPQAGHDVLEAGVVVGGGVLADFEVGLVGQGGGLEPEPGEAGRAGVGGEELELQRGQAPAGIRREGEISMELQDVMMVIDWQRALIAGLLGGGVTGLLRLVTLNPWLGVFVTACTTMWFLAEAWDMWNECESKKEDVAELEKQVVVLKSAMQEMALMNSELEVVNRRLGFRNRSRSSSSF